DCLAAPSPREILESLPGNAVWIDHCPHGRPHALPEPRHLCGIALRPLREVGEEAADDGTPLFGVSTRHQDFADEIEPLGILPSADHGPERVHRRLRLADLGALVLAGRDAGVPALGAPPHTLTPRRPASTRDTASRVDRGAAARGRPFPASPNSFPVTVPPSPARVIPCPVAGSMMPVPGAFGWSLSMILLTCLCSADFASSPHSSSA